MYQIKCDDFHLYDYRLPELVVTDPKLKAAVNTVGEASFVIHRNHPYYSQLKVLKSIFEISDEIGVIFRGRMTNNSQDFHNSKAVDLEGLMAFFNDSVVRPFKFPEDFTTDTEYISASKNGNVVKFFLKWLIDNHNSQVQDFQKFKLGNVTVSDPNNYLSRSESKYANTWEILKNKLFDSALGGYLCIRYEADGNYIDYLSEFELTNTQEITYGENLIDLKNEIDAAGTYSAVIPLGAELETEETDENGEKVKKVLDLKSISDGEVAPDIMKKGDTLYSKSAVDDYGWIYAPVEDTTWNDVTEARNLLNKGIAFLSGEGVMLQNTVEINAIDLHFTDAEIRSFRLYRNIKVISLPHNQDALFPLTSLEIDLLRPQNTKIVLGRTQRTLSEITNDRYQGTLDKIQNATDELKGKVSVTQSNLNDLNTKIEGAIDGTYLYIMYSPYEDGHEMTTDPDENTMYMGTCSTSAKERPTDHKLYTWVKVRGIDGEDGTPGLPGTNQYFHIKYSNDGINFTEPNGEVLGDWMGTCVNNTEDDPEDFDAYTWHRIKGEQGVPGHDGIGIDGTSSYFHIRYSEVENPTDKSQMTENPSKYIGTYVDHIEDDSDDPKDYKWSQFMGTDGIPGTNGQNGQTYYLHIKYSDDGGKTFTANSGETSGKYIGVYTDTTQVDSTSVSKYTWSLLKGADGKDGENQYFYVRYSANANGNPMTEIPQSDTKYMGVCATTSATAPTSYSSYKWSQCKGDQGVPGEPGQDGRTQYWHIKYSDDGVNFTANNGETLGAWIGTYVDFNEADSLVFSDYTWKKFTEDVDEELNDIRTVISSQQTDIERTEEQISLIASKSYVETSALDSYKQEVNSEFRQRAESIDMKFTTTTEQINNVDGDLQAKFEKVSKYISFNENGISIGGGTDAMLLTIDNDNGIIFSRNGVPFGWWDGVDFHTGNIVVEVNERAQFGNFAFVPRTDGSLSFLKVYGNSSDAHTHNYTEISRTEPTCADAGSKTVLCPSCGDTYTEVIPALGCDYTSVVTPPTATAQGYTTYTCKNCGDSYQSNFIPATGTPTTYYTITVQSNNTNYGTVSGGGSVASGSTTTISATPKSGYRFIEWNDGNTNDTRTIEVTGNATYTAYFEAVTSGEDEIIEGVSKAVSIPTKQEYVYIKFVPKYSGSYTFVSLDQTSLDPDGGVYPANKSSSLAGDTNSGGFSVTYDNFVAGTTYYLAVRLWSGTGTVNVRVDYNGSSSGGGSSGGGSGSEETKQILIGTYIGTVSVNGGTPTNSNTYTFNVGESVTVMCHPDDGYAFGCWTDSSGNAVSYSNPYTFTVDSTTSDILYAQ